MNTIDLNRLGVFHRVYLDRSVTEAARKLHITRSAVSQQIAKLEAELGVKLFLRTNRNVVPTSEGQKLFPLIENFMTELLERKKEFELGKREPIGELRIAAPIIFGETVFIDVVGKFKKMYPGVSFSLSFMNQPWAASEKVLSGEVDFAFIDLVDVVQSQIPVISNHLIIERQIVVGNKAVLGPWKNKRMPYEEIVKFPFVAYIPNGRAEKLWCKKIYGRMPSELDIVFDCQNLHAMINGVKQGLGLGLIPAYLVEKELKSGRLIKAKTPGPDYENNIGLVQAPDRKPSLAEKVFIDFTFSELKRRGKYL